MTIIQSCDSRPLHISSTDIKTHVSWKVALEAARTTALVRNLEGVHTRRMTIDIAEGWMRIMAADVPSLGVFGYKEFHLSGDGSVRYSIHLFDTANGRPIGIVDAALVTTLRTAAMAAVAIETLVGTSEPVRLGVIGTGAEAQSGVAALNHVLKINSVSVTSRSAANRRNFAETVTRESRLPVTTHEKLADALRDVDLVYCATNSGGSVVLDNDDVDHVPIVATIGSTLPSQREVNGNVFMAADHVLVDTPDVFEESGDALEACALGFDPADAQLLGQAIESRMVDTRNERSVYKSIGSPEQDIILASKIIDVAETADFGRQVQPYSDVKVNL